MGKDSLKRIIQDINSKLLTQGKASIREDEFFNDMQSIHSLIDDKDKEYIRKIAEERLKIIITDADVLQESLLITTAIIDGIKKDWKDRVSGKYVGDNDDEDDDKEGDEEGDEDDDKEGDEDDDKEGGGRNKSNIKNRKQKTFKLMKGGDESSNFIAGMITVFKEL